ncbi:ankyrin repeat and EF-hand domain-containing protein 1 [Oncorhynchus mykiss]|uniref:ankyrin repeat and EF-hand domain-containing protein 1 n=1 Tax=Oncorhynchus mykiss TaxID=8022 RepID=UPI001878FBCD|nr:ankyrin repeat and EF-hand domain-containing protein 1 [Oncorhynchus mykiss]
MTQSGGVNVHSAVAEDRLEVLQVYRLLQCVREGDTPAIEKMVRLGVPNLINLTEPSEGNAAMHLASVANDTDMVRFLLSQGAHPNIQDKKGRTPVILAAQLGHDNMVALLAKNHANMDVVDTEGKGTLFYCISPTKRHMRCLQVALNSKANVNNVSTAGTPVFLLACERAHDCENMCISILERGADPNATNEASGRSALMEAARAGAVDLVRAILQKGGNPNAVDKKRIHTAHLAAEGGFFEVIVVLSAYSADLSVTAMDGNTPLHLAAAGGFTECCRFLAQRGCNAKLKNTEGFIPSQIAKNNNQKPAMKELKKAERLEVKFSKPGAVNPNELWALTLHDWSCEHEASLRTAMEIAEEAVGPMETVTRETFVAVLQDHRAPVDDENLQKVILEHDKKREGLINVTDFFKGVRYLQKAFTLPSYEPKKKKAGKGGKGKKKGKFVLPMPICIVPPELIFRREDGGPPNFMVESYQQFTDTKRFDRDHPPGHPIEDDSAWYVDEPEKIYININYCVKTGDLESLSLAFSQGVPVDVKDCYYKTPLMTACGSGNYEVAKFLISLGADVTACDQFSWTPLHHASHAGQVDIVDLLVHSGSVVDAVAMNGATPLMRAIESCRPCCVDYLIKAGAKVQAENKKEQNCLDIARAYGDIRITDLVQAKFDSLPKSKEGKGKGGGKPVAKLASLAAPKSDSVSATSSETTVRKVSLKDNIIFLNTQITSGATNRLDISFVPKTVWGKQLTSSQLIERKEERRDRLSYEVDFEDFMMPFNQNIRQKAQELGGLNN